jgi:nitric oxide reductase large subunit
MKPAPPFAFGLLERPTAMHRRNKRFIVMGLLWGLAGGVLALAHLAHPGLVPGNVPRAHGHLMLLGLILMIIYGVGLHVIPRFGGYPLRSEKLAELQFWLANLGLPLMVAGWLGTGDVLVVIGGLLSISAMVLFALNMVFSVRLRSPLDAR